MNARDFLAPKPKPPAWLRTYHLYSVKRSDDNIFSSFASKAKGEETREKDGGALDGFCTETLARIYIDQGYYEQAKNIYSKLLLRYPEKNAYFAALIQKLG